LINVQHDLIAFTREDMHFIPRSMFVAFSAFIFYGQTFAMSFL